MRWLRIFDGAYRRARRAEGRGDYRAAAALYAEADLPDEAASALLVHAARQTELDAKLAALRDALRWLEPRGSRWQEVQTQIGMALLDQGQRRAGAPTREEREQLEEAAERLEAAERFSEAATAYELLDRSDDMARCLQSAGDVERLEALLQESTAEARKERKLRSLVNEYEMALGVGARLEALAALENAVDLAPDDNAIADLLRRLESRLLRGTELRLRIAGKEVAFVGGLEVTLGREADVQVRGTGVSRRHAALRLEGDSVLVRDLESRNGTLLRGIPIAGELTLDGPTEIGLGDDVSVKVSAADGGLELEVLEGLDRGLRAHVGPGKLRSEGLAGAIHFEGGHPTFDPDPGAKTLLGRQKVAAEIVLLAGDRLEVDGVEVEVS